MAKYINPTIQVTDEEFIISLAKKTGLYDVIMARAEENRARAKTQNKGWCAWAQATSPTGTGLFIYFESFTTAGDNCWLLYFWSNQPQADVDFSINTIVMEYGTASKAFGIG